MKTNRMRVKEFGVLGMLLVAVILAPWRASGAPYYWNVTGGGNWSDTTKWNPSSGYPQAVDDANFTGAVAQTVNIATGNQAVSNLSVAGSANWALNPSASSILNLGGTLTYDSTGTNSLFAAPIIGNGTLVVNSGQLMLCPASPLTNGFSVVIVNGGTLMSGKYGVAANANNFGNSNAIIHVGALSGTNDAKIEFGYFSGVYPQPIVIRAGSSGRATLRNYYPSGSSYGAQLGGGITLQKDVHLASTFFQYEGWWRVENGILNVMSPITGAGNVYLDDIYNIILTGTNSYMGQTIVNANNVWVKSSANANTGAITIARGTLYANSDGALGAAENTVTLGGPGTLGTLGMYASVANAITPVNRVITLAGNGGVILGWSTARPYLNGPIGGAGKLIVAHTMEQGLTGAMYGTNNYSGGTLVVNGCMLGGTNAAFGTGDIEIKLNGSIGIYAATNVAPGAKILVKRNPLMDNCGKSGGELGLYTDYVPNIATNSNGKLAIYFAGSTNVNAWLANGSQPIGDGTMFLCSFGSTISATGLAALVANDPTHTYRLGTSCSDVNNGMWLNSSGTTVGALADIGGQPYNVQVGRPNGGGIYNNSVSTYDDHCFSGLLSVYPGTYARFSMLPGADANCVGATNGNVALYGYQDSAPPRSLWIENSATVSRMVKKNDLTYNGNPYIRVDAASGTPTWTTTVQVASLTRGGRSTLSLQGYRGFLGSFERFTVTSGVASNNGMVAPWMWNESDRTFLDYGANGFTNTLWDGGTTLAGATTNSKVNMTVTEQIPAAGAALYALRISNCVIQANGSAVLTNYSGGVFCSGATSTNEAPADFGTNEAVVITSASGATHFFNGSIRGSGGLTKTGSGYLALNADNTTLTGGITINQGMLYYTNWVHLGANTITLNGGSLRLRGTWTSSTSPGITNNIILGPCGGIIGNSNNDGNGRLYSCISGSGWVQFVSAWGYSLYGVSTYTGGTYTEGMSALNLYTNDALGTGPLCMGSVGSGAGMNNYNGVSVRHDRALNTNTFVEMKGHACRLFLRSANAQLGSVEGNGFITLGEGTITRATFGLDNRDAEYCGQIEQHDDMGANPCHIVKAGAGTWTLWGLVTINGSVTVTNGTLRVNNWVNPDAKVFVYPGATLDGIGTVGVVSNLGGTVQGSLYASRLVMNAASKFNVTLSGTNAVSQYGQLHISDGLTLGGSTLNLTLSNFKPLSGQSFTILSNSGTASGTQFACGQIVTATAADGKTYSFRVNYGGGAGGDIVLTALPRGTVVTIR